MPKRKVHAHAREARAVSPPTGSAAAPSDARRRGGGLPAKFVLTSLAATVNLTAAMLGVGFPQEFPALAAMPVMLSLFALGIGLEVWAVRQLLAARRAEIGRAR